jgi:hypothetical protein
MKISRSLEKVKKGSVDLKIFSMLTMQDVGNDKLNEQLKTEI